MLRLLERGNGTFRSRHKFDTNNSQELLGMKQEVTNELKNELGYIAFELTLAGEGKPSNQSEIA